MKRPHPYFGVVPVAIACLAGCGGLADSGHGGADGGDGSSNGPIDGPSDGPSGTDVVKGGGALDGSSDGDPGTRCGPGLVTLASGQYQAAGIAVDSTNVYWTDNEGPVMKVPLCGGKPTTLASAGGGHSIAVEHGIVYWTTGSSGAPAVMSAMSVPTRHGKPQTLESGGNPAAIALDTASLYWTDLGNGAVMTAGLAGGGRLTLASGTSPGGIAVDTTSVYWTDSTRVMKVSIAGGTPVTLASSKGCPGYVAVGSSSVCWTDCGDIDAGTTASVMQVGLDGGTTTTLFATTFTNPSMIPVLSGIAVDEASVYFTSNTTVMKVPLGGGALVTLASGQGGPWGIAVDAKSVYWTNSDDGTVMKLTPK